jgi:hypothetical protein
LFHLQSIDKHHLEIAGVELIDIEAAKIVLKAKERKPTKEQKRGQKEFGRDLGKPCGDCWSMSPSRTRLDSNTVRRRGRMAADSRHQSDQMAEDHSHDSDA